MTIRITKHLVFSFIWRHTSRLPSSLRSLYENQWNSHPILFNKRLIGASVHRAKTINSTHGFAQGWQISKFVHHPRLWWKTAPKHAAIVLVLAVSAVEAFCSLLIFSFFISFFFISSLVFVFPSPTFFSVNAYFLLTLAGCALATKNNHF